MDQMLPSPALSICSIGTPLHQPEEELQILPQAQQQLMQQQLPPATSSNIKKIQMRSSQKHTITARIAQSLLLSTPIISSIFPVVAIASRVALPRANSTSAPGPSTPFMPSPITIIPMVASTSQAPSPCVSSISIPGPSTPLMPSAADCDIVPEVQNVVATSDVGCNLNLKNIGVHAKNAEYNPKRFTAVIIRIREPRTTALIFASGKMVCTGAKSEAEARLASRRFARIVQKLGYPAAKFSDFKIQNIVGSCQLNFPIHLEGLVVAHPQFASYEPELFPGVIYRMVKPRVVLVIFVTGKVIITGAKVREEIYDGFNLMYPILKLFKK